MNSTSARSDRLLPNAHDVGKVWNYGTLDSCHWILGDAGSRRVTEYREAAVGSGGRPPTCLCWSELIRQGDKALHDIPLNARLRIDSFGQNPQVIHSLIEFGGGTEFPEHGEIRSLQYQYRGTCKVMSIVDDWLASRCDIRSDLQPSDICVMFDKWATHNALHPSNRPETIVLPHDPRELEQTVRAFASKVGGRVFLKPRYASSASGVCCLRFAGDRQQLIAAIELQQQASGVRLFNSLKVRSYTQSQEISAIIQQLAAQEMIAEKAIDKARIDGDRFDLRVMVIEGKARHFVVRQSHSPMTNLHLGNRRASEDSLIQSVGQHRVDQCFQLAEDAVKLFPSALHCGVDVLLPHSGAPLICELNAFGDFLPNLHHQDESVYQAIYLAGQKGLTRRSCPKSTRDTLCQFDPIAKVE